MQKLSRDMPRECAGSVPRQLWCGIALKLLSLFGCVGVPALCYSGNLFLAEVLFLGFLVVDIPAALLIWNGRRFIDVREAAGAFAASCVPVIFWIAVALSVYFFNGAVNVVLAFAMLGICALEMMVWGCALIESAWLRRAKVDLRRAIRSAAPVVLMVIVLWALSVEELFRGVKWDSGDYYKSLIGMSQLSFSPADVAQFKNAGHLSYAFSLVYMIGYALVPDHLLGVRLVTLLLYSITIFAFNYLVKNLIGLRSLSATAVTAVFACTPAILGPLHEINPEMLTLCSLVCLAAAFVSNNRPLQMLFALLFVFSKETNVLLLFCMFMGYAIYSIYIQNTSMPILARIVRFGTTKTGLLQISVFYIPCTLFLVHYLLSDISWGTHSGVEIAPGVDTLNSFGINGAVFVGKLKQLYLLNFNWVIVLLILLLALIVLLQHKKIPSLLNANTCKLFLMLAFTYIGFLATQIFYITYLFPRYTILNSFFMCLLLSLLLNDVEITEALRIAPSAVIALLMLVQTFITVDPVTRLAFKNITVGETSIVTCADLIAFRSNGYKIDASDEATSIMALSPYAYYNRQWGYYDNLIDAVLADISYTEQDVIVFPDCFSPNSIGPFLGWSADNYYDVRTGHLFQRFGDDRDYSTMLYLRYVIASSADQIPETDEAGRVFYLRFPFSNSFDDEAVLSAFEVVDKEIITYRGWSVEVLELERGVK